MKIKSYSGLVEDKDGDFCCEKCGAKDKFRMVAHIDGKDFYGSTYNCACGNVAEIWYWRSKKDRAFWD